jgi:hypothetical protein
MSAHGGGGSDQIRRVDGVCECRVGTNEVQLQRGMSCRRNPNLRSGDLLNAADDSGRTEGRMNSTHHEWSAVCDGVR